MSEPQSTSRRTVLVSAFALLSAAALFAAAFYYFDGLAFINTVIAGENPFEPTTQLSPSRVATLPATELELPSGMPDAFALQLWQEQVDSQYMIRRLVDGDIRTMSIEDVETSSADATMSIGVRMSDMSSVNGVIGMRRYGNEWYIAFASHKPTERIMTPADELPSVSAVDVPLLNAIMTEQRKSQAVFDEYLQGGVYSIDIDAVRVGPNTMTIDVTMHENHGKGIARIVALRKVMDGKPYWFLARFMKVRDEPADS